MKKNKFITISYTPPLTVAKQGGIIRLGKINLKLNGKIHIEYFQFLYKICVKFLVLLENQKNIICIIY